MGPLFAKPSQNQYHPDYLIVIDDIQFKLDEGTHSSVFKITRLKDNKQFAMKMSKQQSFALTVKNEFLQKNESRVMRIIDHPFIIKIIEEFDID